MSYFVVKFFNYGFRWLIVSTIHQKIFCQIKFNTEIYFHGSLRAPKDLYLYNLFEIYGAATYNNKLDFAVIIIFLTAKGLNRLKLFLVILKLQVRGAWLVYPQFCLIPRASVWVSKNRVKVKLPTAFFIVPLLISIATVWQQSHIQNHFNQLHFLQVCLSMYDLSLNTSS